MMEKLLKVLVIEDEEDIAHFTCKILEREGFVSLKALDGKTALDLYAKEQPQILMLDLDLGYSQIKGMEVLKTIKATGNAVECIVITRVTEPEIKEEALQLGIQEYLNKPLYPQDWLPKVRDAARRIQEGK